MFGSGTHLVCVALLWFLHTKLEYYINALIGVLMCFATRRSAGAAACLAAGYGRVRATVARGGLGQAARRSDGDGAAGHRDQLVRTDRIREWALTGC